MSPRFLFLQPFHGGSHRDFAEGLIAHSRHRIDLLSLPARFWKWRMRGAALHFYREVADPGVYDGLITTDLLGLADLRALWGAACPPTLVYFHENQLTYPLAPGEGLDVHFGFTNITTGLCAQRILFNSRTHLEAFFERLPAFLRLMPEYRPLWVVERLRERSAVLPPGCHFPAGPSVGPDDALVGNAGALVGNAGALVGNAGALVGNAGASVGPDDALVGLDEDRATDRPPLIVWNHRWEFDKNPGEFFAALDEVLARGLEFRLALLGENFQAVPQDFLAARERYGSRIVQYGFVPRRQDYRQWLRRADIVISTAWQENFGISVVEAIRHGCLPLLPRRLSYPEILPAPFHDDFLYRDRADLVNRLTRLLEDPGRFHDQRRELMKAMSGYAWESLISRYDEELERLAGGPNDGPESLLL